MSRLLVFVGATAFVFIAIIITWLYLRVRDLSRIAVIVSPDNDIYARVLAVEAQLSALAAAASPLSEVVRDAIIKELTHLHTPELDALLEKVKSDTLSPDDERSLLRLLKDRAEEPNHLVGAGERDAAIMLPPILRRIKQEKEAISPTETELRIVSVPVQADE